jgi:transposase
LFFNGLVKLRRGVWHSPRFKFGTFVQRLFSSFVIAAVARFRWSAPFVCAPPSGFSQLPRRCLAQAVQHATGSPALPRNGVEDLLYVISDPHDSRVPEVARECLAALGAQLQRVKTQRLEFGRMITAWHRSNDTSRQLDAVPGVGSALATALVASIPDPKVFRSARDFAAWIGLVPRRTQAVQGEAWRASECSLRRADRLH